jgi:hypothetical protein
MKKRDMKKAELYLNKPANFDSSSKPQGASQINLDPEIFTPYHQF